MDENKILIKLISGTIVIGAFILFFWMVYSGVVELENKIKEIYYSPDTTIIIKNGKADTIITIRK